MLERLFNKEGFMTLKKLIQMLMASSLVITAHYTCATPSSAEPVFSRSTVIGKVFHDINRNGIQDSKEPGLPGIRLATATGLVLETDGYGRFHIPDIEFTQAFTGRNFILKVDPTSLPIGAKISSGNPRVIRIGRALAMNAINFTVEF